MKLLFLIRGLFTGGYFYSGIADTYPQELVTKVRHWFSINFKDDIITGQTEIWNAYNQFLDDLSVNLSSENYTEQDIQDMPIADFIKFSTDWIKHFQT